MKTALLLSFGSVLMVAGINNAASAAHLHTVGGVKMRDFMALSQHQMNAPELPNYVFLHGPTNDPSTATGGPSGGLPDRN